LLVIIKYSLRPIILFANIDVSKHILVIYVFVFAKSNMGTREYLRLVSKISSNTLFSSFTPIS
jgi:hypothetical protein